MKKALPPTQHAAASPAPNRARAALAGLVRQPGQRRHDGALPRAHDELRPRASTSCSRAVRSSASRRPAPTSRRATATTWCWPSACAKASATPAASPSSSRSIPIQETCKRPTAGLDRNLQYLSLVEVLYGYPLDGVVLTTGCDKTTPAQIMAAATVDIPAIALNSGPMLNGWYKGERTGSGTIVWKARELMAAGKIGYQEFLKLVASSAPSTGHCNTMGTASTMNSLAEALGMTLPGQRRDPRALPRPPGDGLHDRPAHRRDGARRPEALGHPDARRVRERDRRQLRHRRLDQCADPPERHRRATSASSSTTDDWEKHRLRDAAAGQPAARGRVPGRGLLPRRRRAGGGRRADRPGQDQADDHRQRQDADRELRRPLHRRPQGDLRLRQADEEGRRLPQLQGQPVRLRDHEDQRDHAGVPRALPGESGRPDGLRRARPSCSTARRTTTAASTTRS